ncbi:MAG: TAXI family TRAP transporter solute-binding subunit [Xanthobacteraceae bacterium]|jgi:TRAP transporter TAXI family solute receptor
MHRLVTFGLLAILTALPTSFFQIDVVKAQTLPKVVQESGSDAVMRERKNNWTVGIAGGLIDGTYMRFADEMAKVLDDGDNLRILPMVSYGAASNLEDLLYLRGVDLAVTQSDVFEYFRTERKTPNLQKRVQYILRLPISEVHILAKADIRSIEDLRGKKVNFGPPGSGSSLTGTIVFQRLGVQVEQVSIDQQSALQKLRSGEVAALVRVVGKPVDFLTRIPKDAGLHIVPIPFTKTFADYYTLSELDSKDYPTLITEGEKVDTIAVPTVLAVFNWQKGSDRYRRIERFVEQLFAKWDRFQVAPRHPKWRDINMGATVPGWTRHALAEQMLERLRGPSANQEQVGRDFQAFLNQAGSGAPQSAADREALFRQFLQWREKQGERK